MVHLRARLAVFVRNKRGDLPQRTFARKMGLAQSTIMRIENEEQNVTLKTLEQLCKAFRVDVGDLFPATPTSSRNYQSRVRPDTATAMVHDAARPPAKTRGKSE